MRGGPVDQDRLFLYEIVSNARNGIDVDKIDYLLRDTQKINVHYASFNHEIIINGARVVNNRICYPEKHEFEIKKLFDSRYNLYRDCYYHRVTQSHECLILDILEETDEFLYDYLAAIADPEKFLDLEDSIIHEARISNEPELEKARKLIDRLDRRQLYSFIGEKGLSNEKAEKIKSITEQDLIDAYKQSLKNEDATAALIEAQNGADAEEFKEGDHELLASDIVIRKFNINMGMKNVNPLEKVSFYREVDGEYQKV